MWPLFVRAHWPHCENLVRNIPANTVTGISARTDLYLFWGYHFVEDVVRRGMDHGFPNGAKMSIL